MSESELQTELLRQLNEPERACGDGSWMLTGGISLRKAAGERREHAEEKEDSGSGVEWRVDGSCSSFDGNHLAVRTDFYVKGKGLKSGPIRIFKHDGRQWSADYEIKLEGFYETFLREGTLVAQHYDGIRIFKHGRNGWVLEQKLLNKDWLAGSDIHNKLQVLSFADNSLLVTSRKYDFIRILSRSADGWVLDQEIEKKSFPNWIWQTKSAGSPNWHP